MLSNICYGLAMFGYVMFIVCDKLGKVDNSVYFGITAIIMFLVGLWSKIDDVKKEILEEIKEKKN